MVFVLPPVERRKTHGERLGEGIERGLSQSLDYASQLGLQKRKDKSHLDLLAQKEKASQNLALDLINQGISPEDAALYARLTPGGQTEFAKKLFVEPRHRGVQGSPSSPQVFSDELEESRLEAEPPLEKREQDLSEAASETKIPPEKVPSPRSKVDSDLKKYLATKDQGLTSAEKVRVGKERYSSGLKQYQESAQKLRTFSREKQNIDILRKINESGKLPTGFGRFNIDDEGNLKYPFGASPEAQRYVKTLNEFSSGAKDTFGSRVTNFDLSQYLKRYPTLLNSKSGRDQLTQQMSIVNDINSVYYKNLKNVYDKSGGVRNIDADVAEKFAEELTAPEVLKHIERFDKIQSEDNTDLEEEIFYRASQGKDFIKSLASWAKESAGAVSGVSGILRAIR